LKAIRDHRAGGAARLPVGPEHEVIDEKLRASSEHISEGRFSFVGLEAAILSLRTHGSSCRRRASSSPRRVSSVSALSSPSRAASQSSRVPVLCFVIVLLSFLLPCIKNSSGVRKCVFFESCINNTTNNPLFKDRITKT
jgi:hypothetical protein